MRTITLNRHPFPHIVGVDFFTTDELAAIQEELKFLFSPRKLYEPGVHHGAGGAGGLTASRALCLEEAYRIREISNILTVYKNILQEPEIQRASDEWPSYLRLMSIERVVTKVRYYHNGDGYAPHTDLRNDFLLFSYFHTEPKKFSGGEVHFPEYDYTFPCDNNTLIIIPGYIQHEVLPVHIEKSAYWDGDGRYCISQFLSIDQTLDGSYIKHQGGPLQYD